MPDRTFIAHMWTDVSARLTDTDMIIILALGVGNMWFLRTALRKSSMKTHDIVFLMNEAIRSINQSRPYGAPKRRNFRRVKCVISRVLWHRQSVMHVEYIMLIHPAVSLGTGHCQSQKYLMFSTNNTINYPALIYVDPWLATTHIYRTSFTLSAGI